MRTAAWALWITCLVGGHVWGQPLPTSEWLVELGRDYPLSPGAGVSDADAEITLLFMEAASRLDSATADSHLWQAHLLDALGREVEARAALEAYWRLDPRNVTACLTWLGATIEALQTAEARRDFCRARIDAGDLAPEAVSELHYRLAVFHWNRGEAALARQEAEAALQQDKNNLAARGLLAELEPDGGGFERQVDLLLGRLEMSPADVETAVRLADLLAAQGLASDADRWYQHAARVLALVDGGPTAEQLRGKQPPDADAPTTKPAADAIRAVLDAFPAEVLEYPFHADKYVALALRPAAEEFRPAEPWRCTIEIRNKGPFAVTIGSGLMLEPELLCLIEAQGDRLRSSGPVLRVPINRRLQLEPGGVLEIPQTLDIGVVRAGMIGTAQMAHQVRVIALLNPMASQGPDGGMVWQAGPGGLKQEARFRRSAYRVEDQKARSLMQQSQSTAIAERIEATELLAMLLAEHQHLAAGRSRYPARQVDAGTVQAVLLARASDADWQVRARLAECMRWFVLNSQAMQAATRLLSDPHWAVRGLAMRMLADQRGPQAESVLKTGAERDPDEWVRRMCGALLERMEDRTVSPSTAPGE